MIPLAGSALVWLPAVLYLFSQGRTGAAIFLAAWSAALVASADNWIRPYVISEQVRIHPLLIFFSLLGGAQAFGVIGLFVGPVIVALTGALLRIARED
jgi:predicted PurR-regulated permease PerM